MDKDLIRGVILVFLTCVSFASLVSSNENKKMASCCSDGLGLNYTLPMFNECKKELHPNGSMVQTIPKLIPYTSKEAACPRRKSKLGIPPGHRVCRFPDCMNDPCEHGWCEETMTGYQCHSFENSSIGVADKDTTTTSATTTTTTTTKSTVLSSTTTLTDEASSETPQPTTTATSSSTTESPTTPSQDLCFQTPCKNGGICQQLVTSFLCTCPQEFYGPVCECPVLHTPNVKATREYTFPGFWIAENVTSFDFMVSADNDAHIGLFASNVTDDRYELAIGGWQNTDGRIVRADSDSPTWIYLSPRISVSLSGIPDFNHYQLSFANGHMKLSRYGTQLALMDATDPNPLAVNYVGIWTGFGSQGYWKFPTFCQESQNQDPA